MMMIDLIKPPTDNLYKFTAIFGLTLIVVGFVYPPWLFYRSSLELLKSFAGEDEFAAHQKFAVERNRIFNERMDQAKVERTKLQQRLNNLAQSPRSESVSSEIDKLETAIKDVKKEIESLEDATHEFNLNLESKKAQARQQKTFSTNETRNSRFVMVLGWIIGLIGLFFATVGFLLWYKRVTVFEDKILQMQATSTIESGNVTLAPEGAE